MRPCTPLSPIYFITTRRLSCALALVSRASAILTPASAANKTAWPASRWPAIALNASQTITCSIRTAIRNVRMATTTPPLLALPAIRRAWPATEARQRTVWHATLQCPSIFIAPNVWALVQSGPCRATRTFSARLARVPASRAVGWFQGAAVAFKIIICWEIFATLPAITYITRIWKLSHAFCAFRPA